MKRKQLKDFESAVKQIASYKPDEPMRKPTKAPSVEELRKRWKLVKR